MAKGNVRPRPPSLVLSRSHSLSKKSPKSNSNSNNNNNPSSSSPSLNPNQSNHPSPRDTPKSSHSPTDYISSSLHHHHHQHHLQSNQKSSTSASSLRRSPTSPHLTSPQQHYHQQHSSNHHHHQTHSRETSSALTPPPSHSLSQSTSSRQNSNPSPGPIIPNGISFLEFLKTWSDDQVLKWLQDLKLSHLASIFAENDIIGDVLLDVDQAALKEMGVSKVGDRVKVIVAVKDLKQRCVRDRDQRVLRNAISSSHLNISNPNPIHSTSQHQQHQPHNLQSSSSIGSFPTSANSNWHYDSSSSSTTTTLTSNTNDHNSNSQRDTRSRSGSLRQQAKAIPPPLRLAERLEGLPHAYQSTSIGSANRSNNTYQAAVSHQLQAQSSNNSMNSNLSSSTNLLAPSTSNSHRTNTTGTSPRSGPTSYNEFHGLPQHPIQPTTSTGSQPPSSSDYLNNSRSRRTRIATDPGSTPSPAPGLLTRDRAPTLPGNGNPQLTRQGTVAGASGGSGGIAWNSEFGLPRAPAPGNMGSVLTRKPSFNTTPGLSGTITSTSSGVHSTNPNSGSTAPLYIKKGDHRKAPSFSNGNKPISLSTNSTTGNAPVSPTNQGSPSTRGLPYGTTTTTASGNMSGLSSILEDAASLGALNATDGRPPPETPAPSFGQGTPSSTTTAPREVGFKVGRGGFGRPTTPAGTVGVVAGTTSQISSFNQPTLDEVMRRTIKVTLSENGIMKTINVENLSTATEFMDRVLKKFSQVNGTGQVTVNGRILNLDEMIICPMPAGGVNEFNRSPIKQLDEHELLDICKSVNRPERQRGLMLRQVFNLQQHPKRIRKLQDFFGEDLPPEGSALVTPNVTEIGPLSISPSFFNTSFDRPQDASDSKTSPTTSIPSKSSYGANDESLPATPRDNRSLQSLIDEGNNPDDHPQPPRQYRHRASVVSVMSGLMVDPFRHSEPLPPDFQASLQQYSKQTVPPMPDGITSPGGGDRAASFLATGKGKLRNFFRPPSELISNHLVDYFPQVEKKKNLSKSVRQSVRKSMAMRRSSQFSHQGGMMGGEDDRGSWDMTNYPGLNQSRFSTDSTISGVNHGVRHMSPIHIRVPNDSSPRISIDDSNLQSEPLNKRSTNPSPSPSENSAHKRYNSHQDLSSQAIDRNANSNHSSIRPNSRLSVGANSSNGGHSSGYGLSTPRKSRDSDNASILTLDEVTAEVGNRRASMGVGFGVSRSENDLSNVGVEENQSGSDVNEEETVKMMMGNQTGPRKSVSSQRITIQEETEDEDDGEVKKIDDGEDEDEEDEEDEDDDDEEDDDDDDDDDDDEEDDEEEKDNNDDPQKMTSSGSKASIKWVRGALIGAGSFGSVYLGMHALNGTLMAVKQVERPTGNSHNEERKKSMLSALVREIEFLKELQHQNIVQYLDSSADDSYFNIFLEYVPGGSVSTLLKNYGSFEEALVKTFTKQILTGLNYLHSKEIIHRDIKGANILVDNKGVIKISDFGISKRVEDNLLSNARVHRPSLQGSVFWMAPEVVKQTSYTRKADIWSLGCLIVEMLTGEHPWANLTQMQAIFRIGSFATPEIPDDITDDCIDLLKQTFLIDHLARPGADQLSNHAFFKDEEGTKKGTEPNLKSTEEESQSQGPALQDETPTRRNFLVEKEKSDKVESDQSKEEVEVVKEAQGEMDSGKEGIEKNSLGLVKDSVEE